MKLYSFNNFQLESFVFLEPVNILEWNFQEGFPLRFLKNEPILDGHGNCLMPATPIF